MPRQEGPSGPTDSATEPKTLTISRIIASGLLGLGVQAQTITNPPAAGPLPDWHIWTVAARDGTTTTRQLTQQVINPLTGEVTNQTHTIIEVATGLNYHDASGAWQESQDAIALTPDGGAAAVEGPLKVQFSPAGLNDDAALTITTPSGQVLAARVQGVYLYDSQSGQSRLLGAPSSSAVAELLSPNQVIYRSAFNSDALQADLRYTYTKGGFESDVIITRQPKLSPQDCGFNPDTTLLQVRHQWQNAPAPVSIRQIAVGQGGAAMPDQLINLGEMFFAPGAAFLTDGASSTDTDVPAPISAASPQNPAGRVPVGKEWRARGGPGGSSLLIESVSWESIATNLASLPLMAEANGSPSMDYYAAAAGEASIWPAGLSASPGLLLDFNLVPIDGNYTNFTFQSYLWPTGPSYVVTGPADFAGMLTLQPNCVIKFVPNFGQGYSLQINGSITCNGSEANPSALTSYADNQYGDPLVSSLEGPPAVGDVGTGLWFDYALQGNLSLNGLVIRYAATAIECDESCACGGGPCLGVTVANSELYECTTGLYVNGMNATIQNSAVNNVTTPFNWAGGCFYNNSGSFAQGYPPTSTTLTPPSAVTNQGAVVLFTGAINSSYPATYQWFAKGGTFGQTYQQIGSGNQALLLGNPGDGTDIYAVRGNPFGEGPSSPVAAVVVLGSGNWSDWEYLLSLTNGATPSLWTTLTKTPPVEKWNPHCLIYGVNGFTAISQLDTYQLQLGQIPVTALTRRHGYTRGHGMGYDGTSVTNAYTEQNPMMKVWYCDSGGNQVTVNVVGQVTHGGMGAPYDYTLLLFDSDLPAGITPMQWGYEPLPEPVELATGQYQFDGDPIGSVYLFSPGPASLPWIPALPLLPYSVLEGGDSGSPVMVPAASDGTLVFIRGVSCSGPGDNPAPPMQAEMDTLILDGNNWFRWSPPLNPSNYQMQQHSTR